MERHDAHGKEALGLLPFEVAIFKKGAVHPEQDTNFRSRHSEVFSF